MKQKTNLLQQNSNTDLVNQQLLATSTLCELTQEEDHPFDVKKPNITYKCRYNYNPHINSWSVQYASLKPSETSKNKTAVPKIQQISHERKLKRKLYEHKSTTLLELSHSIEIFPQNSKANQNAKERPRNRIIPLNSFYERNKILLKKLKKQRSHLSNHFLPNCYFEDTIKIAQLSKSKNKESSAIKKLKSELIEKTQLKEEQSRANLQSLNNSKIRFSLQPKVQNIRHSRYVTVEGDNEVKQQKQNYRKRKTRTLYNNSVRQTNREVKYSKIYSVDRSNPERGLVWSQQFKILINLLRKEKGNQSM